MKNNKIYHLCLVTVFVCLCIGGAAFAQAPQTIFEDDFESDQGWTFSGGSAARTENPAGSGGSTGQPDPSAATSGTWCLMDTPGGDYTKGVTYTMTSPVIDCTQYESVTLYFERWLNINMQKDGGKRNYAYVEGNRNGGGWTVLWQNAELVPHTDGIWNAVSVDISGTGAGQADAAASYQFRFYLSTASTAVYSGWNVDDVLVTGIPRDQVAPDNPTAPCSAWDTSAKGTALTDNTTHFITGSPYFEWNTVLDNGTPTSGVKGYWYYYGPDPVANPFTFTTNTYADITPKPGEMGTQYLRVKVEDNMGNVSDPITIFTNKYDNGMVPVIWGITASKDPAPAGAVTISVDTNKLVYYPAVTPGGGTATDTLTADFGAGTYFYTIARGDSVFLGTYEITAGNWNADTTPADGWNADSGTNITMLDQNRLINGDGVITQWSVRAGTANPRGKFKIFRKNGTVFDVVTVVADSDLTNNNWVTKDCYIEVRKDDYVGFTTTRQSFRLKDDEGSGYVYFNSDVVGTGHTPTSYNTPGKIAVNATGYGYIPSGQFTSQKFDSGNASVKYDSLTWVAVLSGCELYLRFRSATTQAGLDSAQWVGPDGTAATTFDTSGTSIHTNQNNKQWFQYRAYFTNGDYATKTPVLQEVSVRYDSDAYPRCQVELEGTTTEVGLTWISGTSYEGTYIVPSGYTATATIMTDGLDTDDQYTAGVNTFEVMSKPPSNTTTIQAWKTSSQSITIADNELNRDTSNPYFSWSAGSTPYAHGLKGYYYYFGPEWNGEPTTWTTGNIYDAGADPGTEGTYYFRMITEDDIGNVSDAETVFVCIYSDVPDPPPGEQVIWFDNFDTDKGWTLSGWSRSAPSGGGGVSGYADPSSAYFGTNCLMDSSSGDYANSINITATTPLIDTSLYQEIKLRYRRWLNMEDYTYDQSTVWMSRNGGGWVELTAARNPALDITDSTWYPVEYDVSAQADGATTFQLMFRTQTDGANVFSGWNIDQIMLTGKPNDNLAPNNPSSPCSAWDFDVKANVIPHNTVQTLKGSPYFEWSVPTDNGAAGVKGYWWYYGPDLLGEPNFYVEDNFADMSPKPGEEGTQYFRVKVEDNVGNLSEATTLFICKFDEGIDPGFLTLESSKDPAPYGDVTISATTNKLVYASASPAGGYDRDTTTANFNSGTHSGTVSQSDNLFLGTDEIFAGSTDADTSPSGSWDDYNLPTGLTYIDLNRRVTADGIITTWNALPYAAAGGCSGKIKIMRSVGSQVYALVGYAQDTAMTRNVWNTGSTYIEVRENDFIAYTPVTNQLWRKLGEGQGYDVIDSDAMGQSDAVTDPSSPYSPRIIAVNASGYGYKSTGTYISQKFDSGNAAVKYDSLAWTAGLYGGTVKFQFRSASSAVGLDSATWLGPDGTNSTWFTSSGTKINSLNNDLQFYQYKVVMTNASFATQTPVVQDVTVRYDSDAYPKCFISLNGDPATMNGTTEVSMAWISDTDYEGTYAVPIGFTGTATIKAYGWDTAGRYAVGYGSFLVKSARPTNPTTVSAWITSSKVTTVPNNMANPDTANPYFECGAGTPGGSPAYTEGIKGYYVYYGNDVAGVPTTWTTTPNCDAGADPGTEGSYYLRVITEDNLGNQSLASTVFTCIYSTTPAKWSFNTGASGGFMGDAIARSETGAVYIAADNRVYAISANTGTMQWQFVAGSNITATPTFSLGVYPTRVYFATNNGWVYCLDDNGASYSSVWARSLGETLNSPTMAAGDRVYVGSDSNVLHALDRTTGNDVAGWNTVNLGSPVRAAPAIDPTGTYVIVSTMGSGFMKLNATDGTVLATALAGNSIQGSVFIAPTSLGGLVEVFVGTAAGTVYSYKAGTMAETWQNTDPDAVYSSVTTNFASGSNSKVLVTDASGDLYAIDSGTGTTISGWPYTAGTAASYSTPFYYNGYTYYGADDGKVHCAVDATGAAATGWPINIGGSVCAPALFRGTWKGLGSDLIIMGSDTGYIYGFYLE